MLWMDTEGPLRDEGEVASALLDGLSSSAIAGNQNKPSLFERYFKKSAFFIMRTVIVGFDRGPDSARR